jgi:hypothetical protein
VRQPEELYELAEEAGQRPKGMSNYLFDLAGNKMFTRNKTDLAQREEDLGFLFRAMNKLKMDYSVSTDLMLQVEVYGAMLCEQGDTRAENRHQAFICWGLISRIPKRKTETIYGRFDPEARFRRGFSIARGLRYWRGDSFQAKDVPEQQRRIGR